MQGKGGQEGVEGFGIELGQREGAAQLNNLCLLLPSTRQRRPDATRHDLTVAKQARARDRNSSGAAPPLQKKSSKIATNQTNTEGLNTCTTILEPVYPQVATG